jgi:hypothetical protein
MLLMRRLWREPDAGNPPVRFDEGPSGDAGLTTAVSSTRSLSTSPTLLELATSRFRIGVKIPLVFFVFQLATFNLQPATIVGNLSDISLQPLDTRISFAPTNQVTVTAGGLSAGPPRIIQTVNGAFSIALDAGDYTVSLPLLGWRKPFIISVMNTNGTVNITNLPMSHPFPDHNSLHVNSVALSAWSTNITTSLLDAPMPFPANTLHRGEAIVIDAFGSFLDPGGNGPNVTFTLRLGATTIVTQTKPIQPSNWRLSGLVTVRSGGVVAGAMAITEDNGSPYPFPFGTQTAVVDTTVAQNFDLQASIQDFTSAERVICEQLVIRTP